MARTKSSSCPGLSRLRGRSPFGAAKARASTSSFVWQSKTRMAGHRRAEATPSFGRLCPAMTEVIYASKSTDHRPQRLPFPQRLRVARRDVGIFGVVADGGKNFPGA